MTNISSSALPHTSVQNSQTQSPPPAQTSQNSTQSDSFEITRPRSASSVSRVESGASPIRTDSIELEPMVNDVPNPSLWYKMKKAMWASIVSLAFKAAEILPIQRPANEQLEMVTLRQFDCDLAIDTIYTTRDVPRAERSRSKQFLYAAIRWLSKTIPLNGSGMPPISSNMESMLEEAYPEKYQELLPAPVIPQEISERPDDIVGTMALSGPFAAYVEKVDGTENLYKINLDKYSELQVRDGLKKLGGCVYMEYSPQENRMNSRYIKYAGQVITKEDPQWAETQKVALCTLSTDATVVRHLADTHLLVAGTFAGVTTNTLDANHPLRVLLHPHLHQTLSTNNYKAANLITSESSVFPTCFSYDKDTIQRFMNDYASQFDIAKMDPVVDAANRGFTPGGEVSYPYLENASNLWEITEAYVRSYLDTYYESDQALAEDDSIQQWYAGLNRYVPNGVSNYAPGITKESIAKLCTLLIHTAAVEHENVGNITWNYTTLHQYIPSLVPADGTNVPVDVYQRYINTSVLTFIPLNQLMDDASHIAIDERGAQCMRQYRENLAALQAKMEQKPFSHSAMYPEALECSVST